MTNQHHRPRVLGLLAIVATLCLTAAACGSDDEAIEDTDLPVQNDDDGNDDDGAGSDNGSDEPDPGDVTPGYTLLTPRSDLVSLEPGVPAEIIIDPGDDQRLLLHFEGAAEPCSGAAVDVEETDSSVTIDFQIGLDPNAAAMSCIAQVFEYEVIIRLDAPLGDRTINVAG